VVASMMAPTGIVMIMPAMLPSVMAVPIQPLCQPCASRNTPKNGPIPDCMSAMKKLRPSSGHRREVRVPAELCRSILFNKPAAFVR